MKTKGIPFWEQHLEQFVLGLAVLVFVGLVALQFIGSPNSVEVPGKGTVGPGEVDAMLTAEAQQISDLMAPGRDPIVKLADPVPLVARFDELRAQGVSPKKVIAVFQPGLAPEIGIAPTQKGLPFVVAAVPPPTDVAVSQYFDTIVDEEVNANELLKKMLGDPPYDVTWTTVAARFNVAELLKQLRNPGAKGEAQLPPSWFNDRVDILDVKLERQEYVDGQWTNMTIVDVLPGQDLLRPELAKPIDKPTGDWILTQAADPGVRSNIIQPEFFETVNAVWQPPVKDQPVMGAGLGAGPQVDPVQQEIADRKEDLAKKQAEVERNLAKIKELNCPPETDTPAPPKNQPPKGGRGGGIAPPDIGGPSVGGGGGRGLSDPSGGNKNNETECKKIRGRIKKLQNQIKLIEQDLARLLPDKPAEVEEEIPEVAAVVVQPDVLDIWAHDMTVQAGKTYRYRLTVEVYNPLFARKLDLVESQQPMAESFTMKSMASEWTPPLPVAPPLRTFVVSATPAGRGGALSNAAVGQATAEVFSYHGSRWWSESFVVKPGDRIGNPDGAKDAKGGDGAAVGPDYRTDWFVLDVIEDIDAEGSTSQQRTATVLLQSLSSDAIVEVRVPRREATSKELKQLREQVRLSNLEGKVATK